MDAAGKTRPTHARLRDAGMGLAEVVVAIGIFTLVVAALGSTAVVAIRTMGTLQTRVDNSQQTSLGLASASKVLRTAVLPEQLEDTTCTGCVEDTAIVKANGTEVSFYANLGRSSIGPSLVTLVVREDTFHRGTAVLEQRTQDPLAVAGDRYTFCNPASSGCVVQKRILARSLVLSATAVFGYYDTDGLRLPGTSMTAGQMPRISSVDVVLSAQSRPGQTRWRPLTAVQRVRLPNVEINTLNDDEAT